MINDPCNLKIKARLPIIFNNSFIMKVFTPILLVFLLCACDRNKNQTPTDEIIRIDLLAGADTTLTNLSEIASNIEYIPLQTIEGSLIGLIDKVIITDDKIYISDSGKDIVCFDKGGNYISRLSNQGRGPEEYSIINDFDISFDCKKMVILSNGKIFVYEIFGNEYIFFKSIDLYNGVLRVAFIAGSDNILLSNGSWYGDEVSLNLVINFKGDTLIFKPNIYKWVKSGPTFMSMNEAIQYKIGEKVCFKEGFSDTIFYVNSNLDGFFPHLILDSHGTITPPKLKEDLEYAKSHAGDFSSVAIAYEVPRYIFYYYMYKNMRHKIIYDKVLDKKYELALEDGLIDDLKGGPNIDLYMQNCTGTYFYTTIDAIEFKEYIQSVEFSNAIVNDNNKKQELMDIAGSVLLTDNPILVIVTPKY